MHDGHNLVAALITSVRDKPQGLHAQTLGDGSEGCDKHVDCVAKTDIKTDNETMGSDDSVPGIIS